jgi:hypothetical protein
MYRRQAYQNAIKSPEVFGKYDSDPVVSDHSVSDDRTAMSKQISKKNDGYYYVFAIAVIILQSFSMYVSATLQSNSLLIIGVMATALWLILVTWSSEALDIKEKITLSLCAPFIYFLIYLQLIVHIFFVAGRSFVIGAMADQK